MNKEKLTYLSPETETLVVRFEERILGSGSPWNPNNNTENLTEDGDIIGL